MRSAGNPTGTMHRLKDRFSRWERAFRNGWGRDISTPLGRALAHLHVNLTDHAFLRHLWTNEAEISPGVWRSNQPGPRRLRGYARRGFRTILSLRGELPVSYNLLEAEVCAATGMDLHYRQLNAGRLPPGERLIELIDFLATAPRPLLIHCKSGADRTGLAAALHLIGNEGRPVAEALGQLHWRFVHLRDGKTGVLDHLVESYGRAQAETGIDLRDWLATGYDPDRLMAEWRARKSRA